MDDQTAPATQPSGTAVKARLSQAAHVPKAKPDAWPMRFALGASGLAALSALVSAIVLPPRPAVVQPAVAGQVNSSAAGTAAPVQQAVQYVQLQPGQTAPPGARVIDPAAPQPVTIVTTVPAPVQKPVTIKTTQSGKVIP
jgi:hypothetical protein